MCYMKMVRFNISVSYSVDYQPSNAWSTTTTCITFCIEQRAGEVSIALNLFSEVSNNEKDVVHF